jgi:hypothetical protein
MYRMPMRIPDILEKLKDEFDSLSQDVNLYKRLSEDYERQCMSLRTTHYTYKYNKLYYHSMIEA